MVVKKVLFKTNIVTVNVTYGKLLVLFFVGLEILQPCYYMRLLYNCFDLLV